MKGVDDDDTPFAAHDLEAFGHVDASCGGGSTGSTGSLGEGRGRLSRARVPLHTPMSGEEGSLKIQFRVNPAKLSKVLYCHFMNRRGVETRQISVILSRVLFAIVFLGFSGGRVAAADNTLAGSASCAECHESEYKAWHQSHHSWALREASQENVLGDFNNTSFTNKNVTTLFTTSDGQYFVEPTVPTASRRGIRSAIPWG
jgi:hypothetical protein